MGCRGTDGALVRLMVGTRIWLNQAEIIFSIIQKKSSRLTTSTAPANGSNQPSGKPADSSGLTPAKPARCPTDHGRRLQSPGNLRRYLLSQAGRAARASVSCSRMRGALLAVAIALASSSNLSASS